MSAKLSSSVLIFLFALSANLIATGARAAVLRAQMPSEPATLDFSLFEDGAALRVLSSIMNGLYVYDDTSHLKPALAEKSEHTGTKWRVSIKPNAKWSDGEPVRARDFIFAIERTLNPASLAKLADVLFVLKGAAAYKKGASKDFATVGVRALGEKELEFETETSIDFLPHILSLPVAWPQREDVQKKNGADWVSHTPTTGVFKIKEWKKDQFLEVERVAKAVGDEVSGVRFLFVQEDAAALGLFENKKADLLFRIPVLEIQRAAKLGKVLKFESPIVSYIAFNQRIYPWTERDARLAVSLAVDRTKAAAATGADDLAAYNWTGISRKIIDGDADRAKKLWKKEWSEKAESLVIAVDSNSKSRSLIESVQGDLKRVLGLNFKIVSRDWKTHIRELTTNTPPVYRFGWLPPFLHPAAALGLFASESANNYTGWKSANFDALLKKLPRDLEKAEKLLLVDDAVVVPLLHATQTVLVVPQLEGFALNKLGYPDWSKIRLK